MRRSDSKTQICHQDMCGKRRGRGGDKWNIGRRHDKHQKGYPDAHDASHPSYAMLENTGVIDFRSVGCADAK